MGRELDLSNPGQPTEPLFLSLKNGPDGLGSRMTGLLFSLQACRRPPASSWPSPAGETSPGHARCRARALQVSQGERTTAVTVVKPGGRHHCRSARGRASAGSRQRAAAHLSPAGGGGRRREPRRALHVEGRRFCSRNATTGVTRRRGGGAATAAGVGHVANVAERCDGGARRRGAERWALRMARNPPGAVAGDEGIQYFPALRCQKDAETETRSRGRRNPGWGAAG